MITKITALKIGYVTGLYARAGDTFIRNEVTELRRRGHQVTTFSLRRPPEPAGSEEVDAERLSTCYIVETGKLLVLGALVRTAMTRPRQLLRSLAMAMRFSPAGVKLRTMHLLYWIEAVYLASRLRDLDIDILHNHIAENSATVAMLASEISGVPFSMTVHGPAIFWHPDRWALREKIARAAFTACISDFCRSQCMVHSDMKDWPRLRLIRCAVGRQFEQPRLTDPPAAPRALFVGRLCQEKGIPILMNAIAQCLQAGKSYRFVIIGDGPLMSYVRAFIAGHRLESAVELLGWRGSAEVADRLADSRALLLPSLAEGLPVALMEALAMGRPVITTAVAGIPELVQPGHGWLVPPGALEPLVAAIDDAMTASVETLRAMGERGMAVVRERHALTTELDKLETQLALAAHKTGSLPIATHSVASMQ